MRLTKKQTIALDYLEDGKTTDILYGGGAGGGKTILGTYWLLKNALKYPDTRWLMGRSELKTLKETTLVSFFKVCEIQGLKSGIHYKLNQQSNTINFNNKSVILLKDLFSYPSDPNFDSLGSLEITGAFIDECNQITAKAKSIVRSRIRHKLDEYGLIPKLLMTCNPSKGWVYNEFYKPSKEGTLPENKQFIKALVTDNDKIESTYYDNLMLLDEVSKQRLLYGNFEYDDDPRALIGYDTIIESVNDFRLPSEPFRISVDVARFGKDSSVIALWGESEVALFQYRKESITEIADRVKEFMSTYNISPINVVVDEDGVGGGVVDLIRCRGFINNSRPLPSPTMPRDEKGNLQIENYTNLKSQCYFKLAELINRGKYKIYTSEKENVISELEQVKRVENNDKKLAIISKDEVKEILGRSPDFSDALAMGMIFLYKFVKKFADAEY